MPLLICGNWFWTQRPHDGFCGRVFHKVLLDQSSDICGKTSLKTCCFYIFYWKGEVTAKSYSIIRDIDRLVLIQKNSTLQLPFAPIIKLAKQYGCRKFYFSKMNVKTPIFYFFIWKWIYFTNTYNFFRIFDRRKSNKMNILKISHMG